MKELIKELVGLCVEKGVIVKIEPCNSEVFVMIKRLKSPSFEFQIYSSKSEEKGIQAAIDRVKQL